MNQELFPSHPEPGPFAPANFKNLLVQGSREVEKLRGDKTQKMLEDCLPPGRGLGLGVAGVSRRLLYHLN